MTGLEMLSPCLASQRGGKDLDDFERGYRDKAETSKQDDRKEQGRR
jgi:hypothetical protein